MEENESQENSDQFTKEFIARDSLLTSKWKESKNCRSLYNIVATCFIHFYAVKIYYWSLNVNVFDFLDSIKIRDLFCGLIIWLALQVCCWLAFFGFQLWIVCNKWFNIIWLLIYIVFLFGHAATISYYLYQVNLMRWLKFVLSIDIVIGAMKIHSFVRTNVNYILSTDKPLTVPTLGAYLYFLYAPTFFYRKEKYPRNQVFRWKLCIFWLMEIICINVTFFIVFDWSSQFFQDIGSKDMFIGHVILKFLFNSVPGIFVFSMIYVGFFHSYMNLLAEILCFADRKFYSDWWNVKGLKEFIRLSNHIVQDFTYKFIYCDLKFFFGQSSFEKHPYACDFRSDS
jgi:hypothetical protein